MLRRCAAWWNIWCIISEQCNILVAKRKGKIVRQIWIIQQVHRIAICSNCIGYHGKVEHIAWKLKLQYGGQWYTLKCSISSSISMFPRYVQDIPKISTRCPHDQSSVISCQSSTVISHQSYCLKTKIFILYIWKRRLHLKYMINIFFLKKIWFMSTWGWQRTVCGLTFEIEQRVELLFTN